jgi:hypothetical protein
MLSTYLALQAAILLAASDSKPIADAQLVGTWVPSGKTVHPPHGVGTITYHADHTCTHKGYTEEGASFAHGTWRLLGRDLVTRFGEDLVVREIIFSVSANQFRTRAPDGQVFIYTRVKPERPSASNQSVELTATRCARAPSKTKSLPLRATLALGGGSSLLSR